MSHNAAAKQRAEFACKVFLSFTARASRRCAVGYFAIAACETTPKLLFSRALWSRSASLNSVAAAEATTQRLRCSRCLFSPAKLNLLDDTLQAQSAESFWIEFRA
jgi:hypothetical protein